MRAKLGCSAPRGPPAGTQGWEISWLRNLRTRLKMLWMTFMTGAAFSVSRPLGTQAAAGEGRQPPKTCARSSPSPSPSPEDGLVQVLRVRALDVLKVAHLRQPGPELAPADVQDLVGDVALGDLDEVLHLVLEQLQLAELHGAGRVAHQSCGRAEG